MKSRAAIGKSERGLDEALSVLIANTFRKKRPHSLTQIAESLEYAAAQLGGIANVAERIGLSESMLRQFTRVRALSPRVQELFRSRKLDSVDAASHLSALPNSVQYQLAARLAEDALSTKDLRAAIELRSRVPDEQIEKILARVMESKTQRQAVIEFVIRGSRSAAEIRERIRKHVPVSEVIELKTVGALGTLVLSPKGVNALRAAAKQMRIPFKQVMTAILENN